MIRCHQSNRKGGAEYVQEERPGGYEDVLSNAFLPGMFHGRSRLRASPEESMLLTAADESAICPGAADRAPGILFSETNKKKKEKEK